MPRPSPTRIAARLACLCLLPAAAAAAGEVSPRQEALLRRADVGAAGPVSFRARLWLRTADHPERGRIEVWRSGERRTLVRFLDPGEAGKFLLYLDDELWFLAPGAKKPVKLPASFRLRGSASLDDVFGRHYSRDFRILSAEETDEAGRPLVAFQLEPRRSGSSHARVAYVVERDSARPLRAEFRLRSGRLATALEFREWAPGAALRPQRLELRDALRGGALTKVEVLEFEEREVPAGLFDRSDGTARRRLEAADAEGLSPR